MSFKCQGNTSLYTRIAVVFLGYQPSERDEKGAGENGISLEEEFTFEGVFNWRCAGLPPPRVCSSHLSVRYLCFASAAGDVGFESPVGLISREEIWTCIYNRNFCFSTCLNLWVSIYEPLCRNVLLYSTCLNVATR